jgi:WD40 repeat protein
VTKVFVSHAGDDLASTEMVHGWLAGSGHEVFLDHDPYAGIAPGEEWEKRLYERLRWAEAVVCVVTSAYGRSVWCTAEAALAMSSGARVIPVTAEPGVSHPLLTAVQHLDATRDPADAGLRLVSILDRIGGRGLNLPDALPPYPGLRPFDIDRQRVFFGREADVKQLCTVLRSAERADGAVLLLVGPSGCGKSSLVRAGLLPEMADEPGYWTLAPFVPGQDPTGAIVRELAAAARELRMGGWSIDDIRQRIAAVGLTDVVDDLLLAVPGVRRTRLLVVVDQFEELLTQSGAAARAAFGALIGPALGGSLQLVGTLRPEFLAPLLSSPELAGLPKRVQTLEPIRRTSLAAVIEKPAGLAGIELEKGLVDRLVGETKTGDALPLLAYALAELAKGVVRGGRLTLERYDQLGGVGGALITQADAALEDAVTAGGRDRDAVLGELLRLVVIDDQGRPTRWPVVRDELGPAVAAELDAFVDRHLLTTQPGHGADTRSTVEVAHEAFLTGWPPLAAVIDRESSALRARRRIEQAAGDWAERGGGAGGLWEGAQLAGVMHDVGARVRRSGLGRSAAALNTDRVQLSPAGRRFLLASELRDRRRRRQGIAVLSVLLLLATVGGGLAYWQWQQALQQQRTAVAQQLLAQADATRATNAREALLLGLAAERIQPGPEPRANLVDTMTHTGYAHTLEGDSDIISMAYAPDGRTLVTGDVRGGATAWDVSDSASPRRWAPAFPAQRSYLYDLAFAPPDGRVLAAVGADHSISLWDLHDPATPTPMGPPLITHHDIVHGVAFSHDGRTLASVDFAGRLVLHDVGNPLAPVLLADQPTGHSGYVTDVAFSPDDQLLATSGFDHTVRLWNVADRARPAPIGAPLTGLGSAVWTVAFAPAGRLLAAVGADGYLARWDVDTPGAPRPLGEPVRAHTGSAYAAAFAPDGSVLATAGADRAVVLWSMADPAQPTRLGQSLNAHTDQVYALAFAPSAPALASAGADATAVLWNVGDTPPLAPVGPPLPGGPGMTVAMAGSTDGRLVAYGPAQGDIGLLWDVADPVRPLSRGALPGSPTGLRTLAFSADGTVLAGGGTDGSLTLWDVSGTGPPRRLGAAPVAGGPVNSLAFAPDGRLIAVAGQDRTVSLWAVADPAHVVRVGEPATVHTGPVFAVAFAPDGLSLVSGGAEGSVLRWEVSTTSGPELRTPALINGGASVISVAFDPDGRTLATGGDEGSVLIWTLPEDGPPRRAGAPLSSDTGRVYGIRFSPDGTTLAFGGARGVVALWDVSSPDDPRPLGRPVPAAVGSITALSFGGPAPRLTAAGTTGGPRIWDMSELQGLRAHAVERACAITGRGLNPDEWAERVPDLGYEDSCRPG